MSLPTGPTSSDENIERTIEASAALEGTLSPSEQKEALEACRLAEQELKLQISESEYETLLRYILLTIAVIGIFLISISNFASVIENRTNILPNAQYSPESATSKLKIEPASVIISDSLLGLGIELLAGAGLVFAISACIKKDREDKLASLSKRPQWLWLWPWPWIRYWLLLESTLIFGCLGIGLCLSVIPCFCTPSWAWKLSQSAGIELLGGGVLITLFENLERKFKSR